MIRYTVSIAVHNRVDMTRECLRHLEERNPGDHVEYLFSDNASSDDSCDVIMSSSLPNKTLIRYGSNRGFGVVHNDALKLAHGPIFIVMNNDVMIKEKDWLDKLSKGLEDEKVAIVGIKGTPCSLGPTGNGFVGAIYDYVEGSLLMGRTALFKKYGLFSPAIRKFYYEDSDMSLRYRQMGYKVAYIPLAHHHERGATAKVIQDTDRHQIITRNGQIFLSRWGTYLQMRKFSNQVLVRISSLGMGDIIALTPILEGIRRDHPTAIIEVDTSHPEVFENNPNVNGVYSMNRRHQHGYDRTIALQMDYRQNDLIARLGEHQCGTKIDNYLPKLYMKQGELDEADQLLAPLRKKYNVLVCLSLLMSRKEWQGRNWNFDEARKLVEGLHNLGAGVIEVGKGIPCTGIADFTLVDKTTTRQLFAVISQMDFFVGIDSMPFHVAQAFGIRSYVLFGATEPITRVVDFTNTIPIRRDDLECVGCYHKPGAHPINRCALGNEACMQGLTAERVLKYLTEEIDPLAANIHYLEGRIRGAA